MITHTSDPLKARVIFRPNPREWMVRRGEMAGEEFWSGDNIPKGLAAVFRGETDFNGVHFEGFYEGGIIVDPAARAKWKNVTFGENLAPPERLFLDLETHSKAPPALPPNPDPQLTAPAQAVGQTAELNDP